MSEILTLHIARDGNDSWSGIPDRPDPPGKDGPLATLEGARSRLQRIVQAGTAAVAARVLVREGVYRLASPLVFRPADSFPVSYEAYPGEFPEISGSLPVSGWQWDRVNGADCLVTDVSLHLARHGKFNTLFVNGKRRNRPRFPKQGTLLTTGIPGRPEGNDLYRGARSYFDYKAGELPDWKLTEGAEVICKHLWLEERLPVESIDFRKGRIHCARDTVFALDAFGEMADFWIENIFEELKAPGEWYLDRDSGKLYYLPMEGEDAESIEVTVPVVSTLVRFEGNPESGDCVNHVSLRGLTFLQTEWSPFTEWGSIHDPDVPLTNRRADPAAFDVPGFKPRPGKLTSGVPQAAANLPGVLHLTGARNCRIESCTIRETGFWGIRIGEGCRAVQVLGNTISETGAGGVLVSGGGPRAPRTTRTFGHRISDNDISRGGRIFLSAVGIAVTHGHTVEISHNHIHAYFYTGISAGWTWGYSESATRGILILANHIHDIGCGYLSDMGAIYTLGVQPGTEIRGNIIHDVRSRQYGGWGLYLDEGSSHMLVEGNLIYHTDSSCLNIHYGRENNFRNNILVHGGEGIVSLGRAEGHVAANLERNVLVSGQPVFFWQGYAGDLLGCPLRSDLNLFLGTGGIHPEGISGFCSRCPDTFPVDKDPIAVADLSDWKNSGKDAHSAFGSMEGSFSNGKGLAGKLDPACLRPLGISPIRLDNVGIRPESKRIPLRTPMTSSEDYYLEMD